MVVKKQAKMSDLCWKVCDRAQSCCGSESLSSMITKQPNKHLRAKFMLLQSHDILLMPFVDFDCSNTKSDKPVLH